MIVFFLNRRKLDQQGVSQISAEEAVQRADIHVAFICTENLSHEEQIRYFIHVSSVPFVTSQGLFVDAENACMNCCQPKTINKVTIKEFLVQVFNVESILTRAFQICGLVGRHFQHHLSVLSHQSFSAGREARVCGVPHGPELPGCTGALGFSR